MSTYYAEEGLWTGYIDPMRNVRNSMADPDEKVTLGTRRCLIPRKPLSLCEEGSHCALAGSNVLGLQAFLFLDDEWLPPHVLSQYSGGRM